MNNPIYLAVSVVNMILDKMDTVVVAYNAFELNGVWYNVTMLDLVQIGFISQVFRVIYRQVFYKEGE